MGSISTKLKSRFEVWSRQYRQEMGKLTKSFSVPKDVHDMQSLVAQGYHVTITTPYILTQATKTDWTAYLNRAMLNLGVREEGQRLHHLLKYGSWTHHWNEFIFLAYHHHQHYAVFLAGIPDVKGSLPHAKKD